MPASKPNLEISRLRYSLLLLATLLLLFGFSSAARAQAPDAEKLSRGARLYADNCAVCHGANGEGRVGATLAKNWPSIRPDLTVKTIIENGVPGSPMIAWSQAKGGLLSDAEIDDLMYFILSWQTGGPPHITPEASTTRRPAIKPPAEVEGDPNQGAVLYDQNCAVCHGPDGEGRVGEPLAKAWPAVRPDLFIKNSIQNGIAGSPMPAWGQEQGGPLDKNEIDNLVAFILSWETPAAVITTAPTQDTPLSWMSGWGGMLIFIAILGAVVAGAIMLQRKRN